MPSIGQFLVDLCERSRTELLLVAPFIKVAVIRELLRHVKPEVTVRCVTRWRLDELAGGVSDIEVWDELNQRESATLMLRPDLHAKYYRGDQRCLIGSANLTSQALGWSNNPNLEILWPIAFDEELDSVEAAILAGAVEVDSSIVHTFLDLLENIPKAMAIVHYEEPNIAILSSLDIESFQNWLPSLRNPRYLFRVYSRRAGEISAGAMESAIRDLFWLTLPLGLSENSFNSAVGAILLQSPIVRKVDKFVSTPRRFGEVRDFLGSSICDIGHETNPTEIWQTLMRWLRYFLPNRYEIAVPNYSEVIYRVNSDPDGRSSSIEP